MIDHQPQANPSKRKRFLTIFGVTLILVGLFYGVRWFIHGRTHIHTDDAYVTGNLIRITPRVAGTVIAIMAGDTENVKQGQILVKLDDTDSRLALERAEADLAETVRQIRQRFEGPTQQQANLALRKRAYDQAETDFQRRKQAVAVDAVSKEESDRAQTARDQAKAALDLARAQLAAAVADVGGTSVMTHPSVKQAAIRVRAAWLDLARCVIRAPEDGQIAKRSVQIGQQVAPGSALMALVPMTQLWVEANYKENQLKGMAVGQSVELTSDLYGDEVVFHGTVTGLSPGTGSVFSLLPPQNASGNWIKIVQRLPVHIALDAKELEEHPLRVGLSMQVEVDIGDQENTKELSPIHYTTPVYQDDLAGVEEHIQQIIQNNLVEKN